MIAKDIIDVLNQFAPPYLIEDWDNSGLQIGRLDKKVKNLLIALDVDENIVKKAKENRIDMIITHHPLFFHPIKKISKDNPHGRTIFDIINEDIVVFSAHSNLDACKNGVSDELASLLGVSNTRVLSKTYEERLLKLVVFVPITHSQIVRSAITDCGGGWIGNYSHCTYNLQGIGTFMPRENTNPYIGKEGKLEEVEEVRIETIVREHQLETVVTAMISAHPYEEVAYDIYPLNNQGLIYGNGRIGEIQSSMKLDNFTRFVKDKLGSNDVRVYGDLNKEVKRIALCGGSGADFIKDAYEMKADVFLTGDIKYHDAQLALELGLPIIDASHYHTEKVILNKLKEYIHSMVGNEMYILIISSSM